MIWVGIIIIVVIVGGAVIAGVIEDKNKK